MNQKITRVLCLLAISLCLFYPVARGQGPVFTRNQVVEDLNHYHKTLEEVHFNPWLHISRETYLKKFDSLKAALPDTISANELLARLYPLSALLKDGHAMPAIVQPVLRNEYGKKQFLPFVPEYDEKDRLYFPVGFAGKNQLKPGARILSVNGLDMADFSRKIKRYHGGLDHYSREMSVKLLPLHLFLADIKAPFIIRYREAKGRTRTLELAEGITYAEALSEGMPHIRDKAYSYKIIDNKLAYFNFKNMSGDWKVLGQFLDSLFTEIRTRKINILAVDLRQNSGGNSLLGDLLLSYLTRKPHAQMGTKFWKISQPYKEHLLKNGNNGHAYLQQPNGSTWEMGNCSSHEPMFRVDSIFEGRIYFITGAFTFSSANMLADAVKHYRIGTIIGEPTGESTNDFGETLNIELPATKVRMQLTTSFEVGADCDQSHNKPVMPDILIRNTIADKIAGRDPVLEYLRRL
ncbi:S41 family peptidase [Flavihumibacter stibioxidans]|uniref:Tail specific protease domain-containing protein n=1 Tax=Flavihumibacter stibioxidans TaxID=1834163 RepID=A0ABR7MDH6_9BACT|nr:S41 family peptidase [Flavihumibacter stibioxidans]MBC6492992.1 hypothetical protein [Flavihumibacter stibioxidans]